MAQQVRHDAHRMIDVMKECHVSGAQIVEPVVPIRGLRESVPRAAPVAGEPDVAVQAELGKRIPLRKAKSALLVGSDQFQHRGLQNIAEEVVRLHIVIT